MYIIILLQKTFRSTPCGLGKNFPEPAIKLPCEMYFSKFALNFQNPLK